MSVEELSAFRAGGSGSAPPGPVDEPAGGRIWPGVLAVAWVVVLGLLSLAPALAHGSKLGSYDVAETFGLGNVPGTVVNNAVASDQVQQTIPWTELDWIEVHHGHLPLWNPDSAMGTPLLFDFQSAGLSLPSVIVSYAFPLRLAYDVAIVMKLVIAGTGLVFAARVLRLSWFGAALAGTVGELSGSFSAWLAWPMDGVLCWTGWVLGAGILLAEGRRTRAAIPLLAGSLAFAVFGGHPETLEMLVLFTGLTLLVVLIVGFRRDGGRRTVWRLIALLAGAVAGAALATPLLLPGTQALHGSVHAVRTGFIGFPSAGLVRLVFSGWDGYPLASSTYFGIANYYETAASVGLVGVVLAPLALATRWRRPAVLGLALTAVVIGALVFTHHGAEAFDDLPGGNLVLWSRALIVLDLVLALLAGVGFDALVRDRTRWSARWFAVLAVAGAGLVAVLGWHEMTSPPVGAAATEIRNHSFLWPAIQGAVLLVAAAAVLFSAPRGRRSGLAGVTSGAAAAVALSEVLFLLLGTPNLWSSSPTGFTPTPAIAALQALVGDQRVGVACPDATHFADLGILPETNIAYGVAEAELYDAVLPLSYLSTVARLSGTTSTGPNSGNFCVPVTSAAVGRDFGIRYVLTAAGAKAPPGTVADGTIGGEAAWRVPGGAVVSLQPLTAPVNDAAATAVTVAGDDPARLLLHVDASTASRLELHIGAYPGWTARIDGRPLPLHSLYGIELQATVPAGAHTVVVTYSPRRWTEGIDVAIAALVALAVGELLAVGLRRRSSLGGGTRAWRNRQTRQV